MQCSCSSCGNAIEYDASAAGTEVACPHCGAATRLANYSAANPPALPQVAVVNPKSSRSKPWIIVIVIAAIVIPIGLAVIGLLAAIAIPNFIKARQASQRAACISNLKAIQGAKDTWALEHKKTVSDEPTDADLFGSTAYLKSKPVCPAGGVYIVGTIDQNPSCSVPGHSLAPKAINVKVEQAAPVNSADVIAWNRRTLVEAYRNAGSRNAAWDSAAESALDAFANVRASNSGLTQEAYQQLNASLRKAVGAGCDDPMIAYLHARFVPEAQPSDSIAFAAKVSGIASNLNVSDYPPIRRFYACLRAAEASTVTIGPDNKLSPRVIYLRYSTTTNLIRALDDMTTPPEEIYQAIDQWLPTATRSARQFPEDMKFIDPVLKKWPATPIILLTRADCLTSWAWNARGSGFANTVTPQGAKLFDERLTEARALLEAAWAADSSDARIPTKMITVTMGLGLPRNEMETWFQRAMKLDTNNYVACDAKLNYLKPQWFGSVNDMIQFGRQCVSSPWGGRVPLILVDAHTVAAYRLTEPEKAQYWKTPSVWKDIQSSFERFFALNPTDSSYRHNYAMHAYHAEQWQTFNRQLPLFATGTNYAYFGGKKTFDAMVAKAAAAAN